MSTNSFEVTPTKNTDGIPEAFLEAFDPVEGQKLDDKESTEFLHAEFEYLGQSIWKNEERGDRRVHYFLIIAAAVITASVAIVKEAGSSMVNATSIPALMPGLTALLLFGVFTLEHSIQRNLITSEYKRALDKIRERFSENDGRLQKSLAYGIGNTAVRRKRRREVFCGIGQGGIVETVGLLNGIIVAVISGALAIWVMACLAGHDSFSISDSLPYLVAISFSAFYASWMLQMLWVKCRYGRVAAKVENELNDMKRLEKESSD